jgi:hypothetical protein
MLPSHPPSGLTSHCSGRGPLRCCVASALPFRVAGPAAEWRGRWAAEHRCECNQPQKRSPLKCAFTQASRARFSFQATSTGPPLGAPRCSTWNYWYKGLGFVAITQRVRMLTRQPCADCARYVQRSRNPLGANTNGRLALLFHIQSCSGWPETPSTTRRFYFRSLCGTATA